MRTSPDPERASRPYGWIAKLGLIVPPTNTVNEAEWALACPPGVSVHVARMPLHLEAGTPEGRGRLEADLKRAALDLAAAGVDVIAYGCTAGSLVLPLDTITGLITRAAGIPSVATGPAIVAALGTLGARRCAVATPYDDRLNAHERSFLEACGIEVVSIRGMGFGVGGPNDYARIARLPAAEILSFALACDVPEADAIVLSCTDLATMSVHSELEERTGKPVVSSNQATFWAALRAAETTVRIGWGTLLR